MGREDQHNVKQLGQPDPDMSVSDPEVVVRPSHAATCTYLMDQGNASTLDVIFDCAG